MAGDGGAHLRNRVREFGDSSKLLQLLHACVALVIEILPASCRVFSDRLHSSSRCRVDEHVSPRRRNFQIVNPVEVGFCQTTALRLVTKTAFRSAESTYADVLQTFDLCHGSEREVLAGNEICLRISLNR